MSTEVIKTGQTGPNRTISPPKRILAIKLRALGDTVLMTAPISELKRAFPMAEIHVAVTSTWAPLLEGNPAIHKIWTYRRYEERTSRAKAAASLAIQLRRLHFDCVINFHASPSSSMICFATGAKLRSIHFHGHKDRNRYSTVTIPGKGTLKPIIERDMDAVRALGIHIPAGRLPEIFLQENEKKAALEAINKMGLHGPLLMIGLGASRPTKCWPIERFASLAVEWAAQQKGSVLAIAGPEEAQETHAFLKAVDDLLLIAAPNPADRAKLRMKITADNLFQLRHLAALMSQAAVYVGNDSGPKHIAVAVGTPTVTVFGPEHPFEWHPYPKDRHPYLFLEHLPCRKDALPGYPEWCGLDECVQEQHKCMKMIGVDQVLAECKKLALSTVGTRT